MINQMHDSTRYDAGAIEMPPNGINWRAVWGIIRKDLRVVSRTKSVTIPMVVLPLIFVVLIPLVAALLLVYFREFVLTSGEFDEIAQVALPFLQDRYPNYDLVQIIGLYALRSMFAPLFLILPTMTASVIAADAFAGEKERKTLEALLYTPTSDFDLFLAKALGAFIPGLLVAWLSAIVYWVIVDIAAWPLYGRPILPDVTWLVLILWTAPAAAALGLGATVLASSRAKTFQDANQIAGLVVLPIIFLMMGQSFGIIFFGAGVTFLTGVAFYLIAALLFVIGVRTLRRSELIARL